MGVSAVKRTYKCRKTTYARIRPPSKANLIPVSRGCFVMDSYTAAPVSVVIVFIGEILLVDARDVFLTGKCCFLSDEDRTQHALEGIVG